MVFNSSEELKMYILSKMQPTIIKSQEQIYQIINRFVKEYYTEFSPELYERTYQLYRSLVKSDIRPTRNGYEAYIYFDLEALDYAIKKINGKQYQNKDHNEQYVLEQAMIGGTHGGYKASQNTEIWNESMKILNTEAYNILKRILISEGIPIK